MLIFLQFQNNNYHYFCINQEKEKIFLTLTTMDFNPKKLFQKKRLICNIYKTEIETKKPSGLKVKK